jgi:hydroxyacylglutathione hydrolase
LTLTQILLTHAHIDHAGGTGTLARELQAAHRRPAPG